MTTISVMILAALGHLQELVVAGLDADNNASANAQNSFIGYLDPVSLIPRSKLGESHNFAFIRPILCLWKSSPARSML